MSLRPCSRAFQKCEPSQIQNQIKGGIFMLNVAAMNSKEKELIMGYYSDKTFGCGFCHMQLWNIDQKASLFEQIILPKIEMPGPQMPVIIGPLNTF